jgi:hydrogenase maturation protease
VPHPANTIVLGLGNLIRSDDGVGIHAVQQLRSNPQVPDGVLVLDGGTLGLDLLTYVSGARRLLVLDAVDVGAPAGTVVRINAQELGSLPGGGSVHLLGLADLLAAVRITGHPIEEVILLGVQPENTDWGTLLSPPVAASLHEVVQAAAVQLSMWASDRHSQPVPATSAEQTLQGSTS